MNYTVNLSIWLEIEGAPHYRVFQKDVSLPFAPFPGLLITSKVDDQFDPLGDHEFHCNEISYDLETGEFDASQHIEDLLLPGTAEMHARRAVSAGFTEDPAPKRGPRLVPDPDGAK